MSSFRRIARPASVACRCRQSSAPEAYRLGAHHKEGRTECQDEEPLKVDVGPVHYVEGSGLGHDFIEDVHVMHGPAGDAEKRGNVAVQIQQGVHLDGGLALAKRRAFSPGVYS